MPENRVAILEDIEYGVVKLIRDFTTSKFTTPSRVGVVNLT